MAHQADIIPWDLLASNLRWSDAQSAECSCKFTCLHPRNRTEQGEDLTKFADAFAKVLEEAATRERAKYPQYDSPDPDDVLIDDRVVEKILPDIIQWRANPGAIQTGVREKPPLPDEMRTTSAFFHGYENNDCYEFEEVNGIGFFNLEVVKLLIIHGEMEPVLRACAHELAGLGTWETADQCRCMGANAGWDLLYENALTSYLCLNVAYCFPESWDRTAGNTSKTDYRDTKSYQSMLRTCTVPDGTSDVINYPHRPFYGIESDRFHWYEPTVADPERWKDTFKIDPADGRIEYGSPYFGVLPFDVFLSVESPLPGYLATASDVSAVQRMLLRWLPIELTIPIMELAEYKPQRILTVAHDPLHPLNQKALDDYLELCWQIVVRCAILARETKQRSTEKWASIVSENIKFTWTNWSCETARFMRTADLK